MKKTIEIPFGAKDSELKGWEYTIPENMEAEIKDGKIIVKQKESEDERIRKELLEEIEFITPHDDETDSEGLILPSYHARIDRYKSYLEKQKDQKPKMIQWTGKNLKEVIDFTGKSPRFDEWFKSWEEYENYVHTHDNIIKLFCEDGSYYEVPVGSWIVKTPDGFNVPSLFKFVQKPAEWSEKYIANIFEKVGLAKIAREQGNDKLTNALQDAMLELSTGAEWMAGQGETHEVTVESPVLGPPMICCPVHADNGDKVVVQIRKM